jgi:signal transduction histidine kinase
VLFGVGVARVLRRRTERALAADRRRTAELLHDDISNPLGALRVWLDLLAQATGPEARAARQERAVTILIELQAGIREAMWILTGGAAAESPAHAASELRGLLQRILDDNFPPGASVRAVLVPLPDLPGFLPPALRRVVVRIAREAVTNARKHARARNVRVSLTPGPELELRVEDDGVGLAAPRDTDDSGGVGLLSMVRMAESVGGRLEVGTMPGGGTMVHLRVPIRANPWYRRRSSARPE